MNVGNYWHPTPTKWRRIGDTIMLIGAGASTGIMGLPLSDNAKLWAIYFLSLLTLIGKAVTNFFKDDKDVNVDPNSGTGISNSKNDNG